MKTAGEIKKNFKKYMLQFVLSCGITLVAGIICFLIQQIDDNDVTAPLIYVLSVLIVSRYTTGYLCGIIFSVISVLCVNFFHTYPYFTFNFTLSGYPVVIITMLTVSIISSAMTAQIKYKEKIKREMEEEKMRSCLLRGISHDLRTPLTSILGASSALIENDDIITKEGRIKFASEIKEDTQWLIQVVENLLTITRINNSDKSKIVKKPELVEEVVAVAVHKFHKHFPDFNVGVAVPEELLSVPMDAILIEQVIINILQNSAMHSETASKAVLTVTVHDGFAVFRISDDGKGLSNEVLAHLFDGMCASKSKDSVDSKKNMGIGLSVCYTIIKAHGGNLMAENARTGGAVFIFTLPLEENENEH